MLESWLHRSRWATNWSLASAFSPDQVEEQDDDTLEHTLRIIDDATRPKALARR